MQFSWAGLTLGFLCACTGAVVDDDVDWGMSATELNAPAAQSVAESSIVFAARLPDTSSFELYQVRSDGSGLQRLTYTPGDELYPSLSPDRASIAFVRDNQLVISEADGTGAVVVAPEVGRVASSPSLDHQSAAAWSPDGELLAYPAPRPPFWIEEDGELVDQSYRTALHLVSRDGSVDQPIPDEDLAASPGTGSLSQPSWAPNGTLLFVTANDCAGCPGGHLLGLIREDGSDQQTLRGLYGIAPDWSPDGNAIALVASTRAVYSSSGSLRILARSGGLRTLRAQGATPHWAPSGSEIAYAGADGLYVISAAPGSNPRRIVPATAVRGLDW
jgi:Tol biopolymer transport system component